MVQRRSLPPGEFGIQSTRHAHATGVRQTTHQTDAVDVGTTAFNGATLPSVNVPASAVAGETIIITGEVGFDCPVCVVDREIRVVAESAELGEEIVNVGKLDGKGETAPFTITYPAPQQAGGTVSIRLKAQRNPPIGGWQTDNTSGPHTVNIVSKSTKITEDVSRFAPWAVGGAGVGYGAARATDSRPLVGVTAGAGLGVATKAITGSGSIQGPQFPTTAVVATTGLFAAGAFFLDRLPGTDLI